MTGDISQPKKEMEGVGGRRFEVEMKVEAPGAFIHCMNEKARDADCPSCGHGRFYGGLEQCRTKPAASVFLIHSHSRQDDGGDRVGHVAASSTPYLAVGHRSVGKGVKPNDSTLFDHDVRLGCAGDLVCHRPLLEPLVKLWLAAGEARNDVIRVEGLRSVPGPVWHLVSPGGRLSQQLLKSRLVDGWPLQQSVELLPRGIIDREVPTVRQVLLGGTDRMADHVIRNRLLLRRCGRLDDLPLLGRHSKLEPV